jgi:hypothetical protein
MTSSISSLPFAIGTRHRFVAIVITPQPRRCIRLGRTEARRTPPPRREAGDDDESRNDEVEKVVVDSRPAIPYRIVARRTF